jgi:hypothetical protein
MFPSPSASVCGGASNRTLRDKDNRHCRKTTQDGPQAANERMNGKFLWTNRFAVVYNTSDSALFYAQGQI